MKFFIVLLSFVFLSGCISHPDYPSEWPEISDTNKCPHIDGFYSGVGKNQEGREANLYNLIFGGNSKTVEAIEITTIDHEINIHAYDNNKIVDSRAISNELYKCNNSLIEIGEAIPEGGINREGVVGVAWGNTLLSNNINGNLVVRSDSGGVAVVLLIPVAGSMRSWYQFSAIEPNKSLKGDADKASELY